MPIAQYKIGTAQRPQLYHDAGFADCSRAATVQDKAILAGWRIALEAAEAAEAGQGVPFVPHNNLAQRRRCRHRGSPRDFAATVTLHAGDLYNFNPGDEDMATQIPDALNGRLEESCLGQEYTSISKLIRVVRWQEKAAQAAKVDQSDTSRQRNPQDNLRLRNRI